MVRNLRPKDFVALNHGAYALFLLVALGVLELVSKIGDIALGGEMSIIPGLPIAQLFVWGTFGVGVLVARRRKRYDKLDKVGLGIFSILPFATFFVVPISEFVLGNPLIGFVFAVPMLISYALVVIR